MKNPGTKPVRTRAAASDEDRVKQAVTLILKKLKRGQKWSCPVSDR